MTRLTLLAAAMAAILAVPAVAQDSIHIVDPYARSASATAITGAAYMVIENRGAEDDRLIEVRSDAAERVELHAHLIDADGVARMVVVEDGLPIPAGGSHELRGGGDHIMLMGLKAPLVEGEALALTLVFERAGTVEIEVPVDLSRKPGQGHMQGQGG